jgi:DNA (cytosine-5)-methyltransferase 1
MRRTKTDLASLPARSAARTSGSLAMPAARLAALKLNDNWQRAKAAPAGPVDVIDMFSGCGGMSAGFVSLNGVRPSYRLAGAIDVDEIANRTYEMNLGVKPLCADIGKLARRPRHLSETMRTFCPDRSRKLVLIGCAPCQGFSSHRNAAGAGDSRNSLFLDFARIAARIRPDAIVVENVPELLTDKYWQFVVRARELLNRAGFFVHLSVHNMAEFGVAQERFRAVMLALPRRFTPPRGFLARAHFRTVRDAIGHLPAIDAGVRNRVDPMHFTAGHKESTLKTIRAVPLDGGSRPEHVGPACLRRAGERNGRAVYEDVYGRLFWDRPAITITAYARNPASGRYVHPEQHRGLSIREAALLQGFPENYSFAGSLDESFRQIGNAVPPQFSVYLAAYLFKELARDRHISDFDGGICAPVGPSFSRLIPSLKAGHRRDFSHYAD